MAQVIAIGPGGVAQAPVRDDRFREFIGLALQAGMLDKPVLSPVCSSMDQATETKRALYRSAWYFCSCDTAYCTRKWKNVPHSGNPGGGCPRGGQRVGCQAEIVKDKEGKLRVQVTLRDKREAMRTVVEKYGPDPSKWPYQASAKRTRE